MLGDARDDDNVRGVQNPALPLVVMLVKQLVDKLTVKRGEGHSGSGYKPLFQVRCSLCCTCSSCLLSSRFPRSSPQSRRAGMHAPVMMLMLMLMLMMMMRPSSLQHYASLFTPPLVTSSTNLSHQTPFPPPFIPNSFASSPRRLSSTAARCLDPQSGLSPPSCCARSGSSPTRCASRSYAPSPYLPFALL